MLKNNKNILTILDICSSKVVCIIAKCEGENKNTILGLGYVRADGMRGGIVSDFQLAQISIRNAISLAEKNAGVQSFKAHVSISANYLISQRITTEIIIFSKEITHRELNKLLLEAIQICKNQKLRVIHTFVCNYILRENNLIHKCQPVLNFFRLNSQRERLQALLRNAAFL